MDYRVTMNQKTATAEHLVRLRWRQRKYKWAMGDGILWLLNRVFARRYGTDIMNGAVVSIVLADSRSAIAACNNR